MYVVFEKEVIFHANIKRLQAWSLLLDIWKHTNLFNKGVFFFDDQLSQNFHRCVILCTYWGTSSENTGLLAITKGVQCL